jgi:hypothetical protein
MSTNLDIELGPTQTSFVYSTAMINILISNTGEGKTWACILAVLEHASRCGRPIRCAFVRDTHENIKNSMARSIIEFFECYPKAYKFTDDYKRLVIYHKPRIQVDLFGIDDLASLSKLQGPEYALIWLEEPAPISGKLVTNAGLSEEVYNAAMVRATRQKGTIPRLQVSMNPAEQDHWTYRRFIEEADFDPEYPLITKAVFRIQPGENRFASQESRQAVAKAYSADKSSFTRFVRGEFAPVYKGKKVAWGYNPIIHRSPEGIVPAHGLDGFMAFDGWHNPVCHMGQITSIGRMVWIDTLRLEGSDIGTLIKSKVLPMLNHPRWKDKCRSWRYVGDISMMDPDGSSKVKSQARVIEDTLGGNFEGGPKRWERIYSGMAQCWNFNIQGLPSIVINRDNRVLHRCLDGGWHFPTDPSGNIKNKLPEKDDMSHVGDAFANGVCVLLPVFEPKRDMAALRRAAARSKARASSYGGEGAQRH